jgi:hypothetical protein
MVQQMVEVDKPHDQEEKTDWAGKVDSDFAGYVDWVQKPH